VTERQDDPSPPQLKAVKSLRSARCRSRGSVSQWMVFELVGAGRTGCAPDFPHEEPECLQRLPPTSRSSPARVSESSASLYL
jgi:hypothetical protein